jgi:AraC-like DNA-binding protein
MQDTIVYAIAAGSLFLLLLTTLATPRKVNVQANYWLVFFLFSFACILLDRVLFDTQAYEEYPGIMGLLEITRFGMSPALYFSVLHFTIPDRKFQRTDYLHFVPFALFFLYIVTYLTGINQSFLFSWYSDLPENVRRGIGLTVFVSIKVQMILYWILSYVQLTRHTKNVRMFASTVEPISLSWLRYFLLGLALALFLSLNETLNAIPAIVPLTHFGYLFLVFYLGYFSLRQQEIYPYQQRDVEEIRGIIEEETKHSRFQRFSDEELGLAKRKLLQVMESEKVFLDPNLGLPQLAAKVHMSTHDLSFLINEGFGENFFQFVNRYRVEEAKTLLKSGKHKHLNILGIAYESGFRSKSTFNTTFKKLTGLSPSQFMQTPATFDEKAA